MLAHFLALGATLSFSGASLIFALYSRRISVLWMNSVKALVALVLLALTLPVLMTTLGKWDTYAPPSIASGLWLLASGAIGLGIGDLFLLNAYTRLGVPRTLILYGFQPILLGAAGSVFFDQTVSGNRIIAIVSFIACLVIFNLEHYREHRTWELRGLGFALIGVSLDSAGVVLTRLAFAGSPQTLALEGHFIRCVGALACYAVIAAVLTQRRGRDDQTPVIGLVKNFSKLDRETKRLLFVGCFFGTYLSLCLYLTAIQIGNLATISAISITGPVFAAVLESVVYKKPISRYLALAFICFAVGFASLILD